jgi:hypothetical protein
MIYAYGVAVDSSGNIYIADQGQNGIVKETLSAPQVPYYRDANGNPEIPASLSNPTSTPLWIDGKWI